MPEQGERAALRPIEGRPGMFTYADSDLIRSDFIVPRGLALREILNNGSERDLHENEAHLGNEGDPPQSE